MYVYDDEHRRRGGPLKLGDPIEGGGNHGTLVDIQWQRLRRQQEGLAGIEFEQLGGRARLRRRITRAATPTSATPTRSQQLIIDPGPRQVNGTTKRRAAFDRDGDGSYATVVSRRPTCSRSPSTRWAR